MSNYYNPGGYMPPSNPYQERLNNMLQQQQAPGPFPPPQQEVVRVNGKDGAEAYRMAPNSSVLLLDETKPLVWLKTTDGAGYPSLTAYEITPYEPPAAPDYGSISARLDKLEGAIGEILTRLEAAANEPNPRPAQRAQRASAAANAAAESTK